MKLTLFGRRVEGVNLVVEIGVGVKLLRVLEGRVFEGSAVGGVLKKTLLLTGLGFEIILVIVESGIIGQVLSVPVALVQGTLPAALHQPPSNRRLFVVSRLLLHLHRTHFLNLLPTLFEVPVLQNLIRTRTQRTVDLYHFRNQTHRFLRRRRDYLRQLLFFVLRNLQ